MSKFKLLWEFPKSDTEIGSEQMLLEKMVLKDLLNSGLVQENAVFAKWGKAKHSKMRYACNRLLKLL